MSDLRKPTLRVKQGSRQRFLMTITNADGSAYNLASSVLTLNVKRTTDDETALISKQTPIGNGIEVVSAANGQIRVIFEPSDTTSLNPKLSYVWDIWDNQGSGVEVPLIGVSKFVLQDRVTKIT